EKAAHLQSLLRKRARFAWTDVQAKAFQELKDALVSAAVLAYPNKEQPFKLMTDASDIALGAVLMQWNPEEKRDYIVSYASKALNPAEKNYDTTDREGLAAVWAIRKYK
ncbi:476_t:CDS:1, partial [Paraglomus occultum]